MIKVTHPLSVNRPFLVSGTDLADAQLRFGTLADLEIVQEPYFVPEATGVDVRLGIFHDILQVISALDCIMPAHMGDMVNQIESKWVNLKSEEIVKMGQHLTILKRLQKEIHALGVK